MVLAQREHAESPGRVAFVLFITVIGTLLAVAGVWTLEGALRASSIALVAARRVPLGRRVSGRRRPASPRAS
ncbi:hypothetical protein [Terrabacter sp. Ter38]|uniref:hypothetical protein n=1 Tax=Terrabacter sp. Ter38 TaxID=2926030 RepID=UPI00211785FB|nr:hypothetical protein [Terrabacter sp. Ter38]